MDDASTRARSRSGVEESPVTPGQAEPHSQSGNNAAELPAISSPPNDPSSLIDDDTGSQCSSSPGALIVRSPS